MSAVQKNIILLIGLFLILETFTEALPKLNLEKKSNEIAGIIKNLELEEGTGSSTDEPPGGSEGTSDSNDSTSDSISDSTSDTTTGGTPTGGPTGETPTDGPTGETPTNGPTGETPTDGPTGETPTDGPTGETPTYGPTGETPTNGPTGETPTDGPTGEIPTEPATTDSPDDIPDYVWGNDKQGRCILAKMKIVINVKYEAYGKDGKSEDRIANVVVPQTFKVQGLCIGENGTLDSKNVQGPLLILTWTWDKPEKASPPISVGDNWVAVQFKKDEGESAITNIKASIKQNSDKYFPDAVDENSKSTADIKIIDYSTDPEESFTCSEKRTYEGDNEEEVILEKVRFQIGENLDETFGEGEDCKGEKNNTVAIAVGVTILVLIIIVGGGFLYKRSRDKK